MRNKIFGNIRKIAPKRRKSGRKRCLHVFFAIRLNESVRFRQGARILSQALWAE